MPAPQPPFLPEEIAQFGATCGSCSRRVRPDIWKRFDEPFGPIYPNGTSGEAGMFQRQSIGATCVCGASVQVSIDPKTLRHNVYFYGDEADRDSGAWKLQTYSFVGASRDPLDNVLKGLTDAKARLIADRDPASWQVHTEIMFSGHKRLASRSFRSLRREDIQSFFEAVADSVASIGNASWATSVFGFRKREQDRRSERRSDKESRSIMHLAILSTIIWRTTKLSAKPLFFLDAVRDVKSLPHIEGWSTHSYLGSRHYLAHEILTHGNEIPAPTFVKPRSVPESELADIVAYFVARNLLHRLQRKETEIPISRFGNLSFIVVADNNHIDTFQGEMPEKYFPR